MGGDLPRVPGGRVTTAFERGLWFLKSQPTGGAPGHSLDLERDDGRAGRRKLLCGRCRRVITGDTERVERNGRHAHVFANPHGIAFEIGCFAEAPGCFMVGPRERQFSWFPGYTWQLSGCRTCHAHLGWRFQAAGRYFYGLILNRLIPWQSDEA